MERTSQTTEPHCLHCHLRRTPSTAAVHIRPADELTPLRNLSESRPTSGTSPVGALGPSRARSVVAVGAIPHDAVAPKCEMPTRSVQQHGPLSLFLQSAVRQKNACFFCDTVACVVRCTASHNGPCGCAVTYHSDGNNTSAVWWRNIGPNLSATRR